MTRPRGPFLSSKSAQFHESFNNQSKYKSKVTPVRKTCSGRMARSVRNCQFCTYSSNHTNHLKVHVNVVHLDIRKYKCDLCEYKGTSKPKLKRHKEAIHEKTNDHECNKCEFKSSTSNQLNAHKRKIHENVIGGGQRMRAHTNTCDQCEYKAPDQSKLKRHKKAMHDKIRDHECNQCNYRSSTGYQLKEHKIRIHKETREYPAPSNVNQIGHSTPVLGKAALGKEIKEKQQITHSNACDQCQYRGTDQHNLKRHKKAVHDKIRDNECNMCNYKIFHSLPT